MTFNITYAQANEWAQDVIDRRQDYENSVQEFSFGGTNTFEVIPRDTSNFQVFCLCNPTLSSAQHHTIWEYYRSQFIHAKLQGCELSRFRINLGSFIAEGNSFVTELNPGELVSKSDQFRKSIGLALWLKLQYETDTTIDNLNKNISPQQMTRDTKHLTYDSTIVSPGNYVSYFSQAVDPQAEIQDVTSRKLTLKTVFNYGHKNKNVFVCDTKFGAAKLVIPRLDSMNHWLNRNLSAGLEVVVLDAQVATSIDNTVPWLKINRWYVE